MTAAWVDLTIRANAERIAGDRLLSFEEAIEKARLATDTDDDVALALTNRANRPLTHSMSLRERTHCGIPFGKRPPMSNPRNANCPDCEKVRLENGWAR